MNGVIERALDALMHLVNEGVEYPEAHARVAIAFQLTDRQADQLTEAYDGK
jgi:uncharacterized protein YqgV (UPF0045/DUF77 family)